MRFFHQGVCQGQPPPAEPSLKASRKTSNIGCGTSRCASRSASPGTKPGAGARSVVRRATGSVGRVEDAWRRRLAAGDGERRPDAQSGCSQEQSSGSRASHGSLLCVSGASLRARVLARRRRSGTAHDVRAANSTATAARLTDLAASAAVVPPAAAATTRVGRTSVAVGRWPLHLADPLRRVVVRRHVLEREPEGRERAVGRVERAVRVALLLALVGPAWLARRRRTSSPVGDSD